MAFNVDFTVCIVIMAVLTGIYVIAGGYMATAINDFIQGIIMLFGICAVIWAILESKGGFTEAMNALAEVEDPQYTQMNGAFASFLGAGAAGSFRSRYTNLHGYMGTAADGSEVLRHKK